MLKWRMSNITPNVVKHCIARSGFRASRSKYIDLRNSNSRFILDLSIRFILSLMFARKNEETSSAEEKYHLHHTDDDNEFLVID